ncbi:hypothetical protein AAEY27_04425 [Kosakonia sp. BYX6]|uniref:Uncharacterized protein n=1 Tax=Kosakonia calanthes TaxID=3139408 RepID=A0ABZ3B9S1_9ENTR
MKADAYNNGLPVHPDPLLEQPAAIPPFVKTMAVRLSWASAVGEPYAYHLLSAPYHHGVVTSEDKQQLLAHFPFMAELPEEIADYTIMLVTLWLNIEELYHRGTVLPEGIMQALMKKTATMPLHDCREKGKTSATCLCAPRGEITPSRYSR